MSIYLLNAFAGHFDALINSCPFQKKGCFILIYFHSQLRILLEPAAPCFIIIIILNRLAIRSRHPKIDPKKTLPNCNHEKFTWFGNKSVNSYCCLHREHDFYIWSPRNSALLLNVLLLSFLTCLKTKESAEKSGDLSFRFYFFNFSGPLV